MRHPSLDYGEKGKRKLFYFLLFGVVIEAFEKEKHGTVSALLNAVISAEPRHLDESTSSGGRSAISGHSAGLSDPLQGLECAFCHSKRGTLKRCLGSEKVFCCGKTCQKEHWKKHKIDCRSNRKL